MFNWWSFAFDASQMAIEAQEVITLRLQKFARGDAAASAEITQMFTEKSLVVGEAWVAAASVAARGGDAQQAAAAFLRPYRKRVRANRRRLSR